MSQQEFQQPNDENADAQAYYRPPKQKTNTMGQMGNTGNMPKNEHPSTFEESIPPYSYKAQDGPERSSAPHEQLRSTGEQSYQKQQQQQQYYSPDGDAFEQGYQPYASMQQQFVPPWARPQRNAMKPWRWVVLVVLGVLLIKPVLILAGIAIAGIGFLLGAALLVVLLPIIIIFSLLAVFSVMALIVMSVLGVPIRPGRWWGQWRGYRRNRNRWRA